MEAQRGDPKVHGYKLQSWDAGPGLMAISLGLSSLLLGEMKTVQGPQFSLLWGLQGHPQGPSPTFLSLEPTMPHPPALCTRLPAGSAFVRVP